eukprot:5881166-Prymnesium_polylepis.1
MPKTSHETSQRPAHPPYARHRPARPPHTAHRLAIDPRAPAVHSLTMRLFWRARQRVPEGANASTT